MAVRPEFIFKVHKQKWHWIWECFTSTGISRGRSRTYNNKVGAVHGARNFIKNMKPGVAILDESWRDRAGYNKRKTL